MAAPTPNAGNPTTSVVGGCQKQVHRNLSELEDIGVIEFEGDGSGQAKKPVLAYDGLEIDIPFADSDESVGTVAP
jgi:predicted transcriptional regulator